VSDELTRLDDVKALRALAARPDEWPVKAPPHVQSELVLPLAKMQVLGGTLDDLLAAIENSLQVLAHPSNANLARTMTAIEHVNLSLDISLANHHDADRERGAKRRRQQPALAATGVEARRNKPLSAFDRAVREYFERHPEHSSMAAARHLPKKFRKGKRGASRKNALANLARRIRDSRSSRLK
jgi:hypothetical protein